MERKKIIFASTNPGKLAEIRQLLPADYELLSPADIQFDREIEETGKTFEDNANIKATALFEASGISCFADDSGLEVEVLNKQPGVKSARYAGEPADNKKNIALLLKNLEGKNNRKAGFVTVICLKTADKTFFFEGRISGAICKEPAGNNGFGYDSVFVPDGYDKTFAEMDADLKNSISHRKRALDKMLPFLEYL